MSTNEPMTQDQLDAIRERLVSVEFPDNEHLAVTDGDENLVSWVERSHHDGSIVSGGVVATVHAGPRAARMFAHAPQDLADLLAEVHRLRAELAKSREVTDDMIERAALVDLNMGLKFRGLGPVKSLEEIKPILGEEGPYRLRSTMRAALIAVLGGGKNV